MELTPKEKADELILKFKTKTSIITRDLDNDICVYSDIKTEKSAIEDAIIAVELLLDDDMYGMDENNFDKRIEYYQEVKQELLNRK